MFTKNAGRKVFRKQENILRSFLTLKILMMSSKREVVESIKKIYGINGRLLKAIKEFYRNSKECVRIKEGRKVA